MKTVHHSAVSRRCRHALRRRERDPQLPSARRTTSGVRPPRRPPRGGGSARAAARGSAGETSNSPPAAGDVSGRRLGPFHAAPASTIHWGAARGRRPRGRSTCARGRRESPRSAFHRPGTRAASAFAFHGRGTTPSGEAAPIRIRFVLRHFEQPPERRLQRLERGAGSRRWRWSRCSSRERCHAGRRRPPAPCCAGSPSCSASSYAFTWNFSMLYRTTHWKMGIRVSSDCWASFHAACARCRRVGDDLRVDLDDLDDPVDRLIRQAHRRKRGATTRRRTGARIAGRSDGESCARPLGIPPVGCTTSAAPAGSRSAAPAAMRRSAS